MKHKTEKLVLPLLNDEKNNQEQMVAISIAGRDAFRLPLVRENSHGFICRTGIGKHHPAEEWFAKDSSLVKSHLVKH